jgi:hypothetical protein
MPLSSNTNFSHPASEFKELGCHKEDNEATSSSVVGGISLSKCFPFVLALLQVQSFIIFF